MLENGQRLENEIGNLLTRISEVNGTTVTRMLGTDHLGGKLLSTEDDQNAIARRQVRWLGGWSKSGH
jgi:hypothetical protein